MLKMFTTQLGGLFKKIHDRQEFAIEDAARLLAQAPVGDGNIYIYGMNEMEAVSVEATLGAEPLKGAIQLYEASLPPEYSDADRMLIVTRNSNDSIAIQLAKTLFEKKHAFIVISSISSPEFTEDSLVELADVHLDLGLTKGLLPAEDGTRFGMPTSMAALYVYFALKFTIDEILEEF